MFCVCILCDIRVYECEYICTHVFVCINCVFVYTCVHVSVCERKSIYVYVNGDVCICIFVFVTVCIPVYVRVCLCVLLVALTTHLAAPCGLPLRWQDRALVRTALALAEALGLPGPHARRLRQPAQAVTRLQAGASGYLATSTLATGRRRAGGRKPEAESRRRSLARVGLRADSECGGLVAEPHSI